MNIAPYIIGCAITSLSPISEDIVLEAIAENIEKQLYPFRDLLTYPMLAKNFTFEEKYSFACTILKQMQLIKYTDDEISILACLFAWRQTFNHLLIDHVYIINFIQEKINVAHKSDKKIIQWAIEELEYALLSLFGMDAINYTNGIIEQQLQRIKQFHDNHDAEEILKHDETC